MQINIGHGKRVQAKRKELYYRVRKLARNSKVVLLLDFALAVKSPLKSVLRSFRHGYSPPIFESFYSALQI